MSSARERDAMPARRARFDAARLLLVAMPLIALVPKLILILHSVDGSSEIFQTGFGFGEYIRSLSNDGALRSCGVTPFTGCDPNLCVYATRMPLVPLLYAGLAHLVGVKSVAVAIAK